MILGEGAGVCCLENGKRKCIGLYRRYRYATEVLEHISISAEATCSKSMKMALENTDLSEVDVVVMHAPGTIKGDITEYKAIESFGTSLY
jgi:3-oxoacyl-(acyl-carrier-protein) synthase